MTGRRRGRVVVSLTAGAIAVVTVLLLAGTVVGSGDDEKLEIAKQGHFYVGITDVAQTNGTSIITNQMYVQYQIPKKVTHPYPIVFVHGGGGQGLDYLGTPDGRPGWATIFAQEGYEVYVVDRPAYGRSPNNLAYGALGNSPTREQFEQNFTAIELYNQWPQAHLHTQWPGTGVRGDPIFEQFVATQNPGPSVSATVLRANMAELLDGIGPAIVVTHSAGGPTGWVAVDERPSLVKGLIAVETGTPQSTFLTYDPAITSTADLTTVSVPPNNPDYLPCTIQTEPARELVNFKDVPILTVASEAGSATRSNQCVSTWINQAGGDAELLRLEEVGIHGNGHMMMLEKNNRQIALTLIKWLRKNVER
jgi:pimeloyl-ACP methyl ester carboxylesterase